MKKYISIVLVLIIIIVIIYNNLPRKLIVQSDPSDAIVILDSNEQKTPFTFENLKAKKYNLTIMKEGYFVKYQTIKVRPLFPKTITIKLDKTEGADFEGENQASDKYAEYYKQYPIEKLLPYNDNAHFNMIITETEHVYQINLFATLNEVDQIHYERYIEEVKLYKQEALDWIRSNNINPATLNIKWVPEEAINL